MHLIVYTSQYVPGEDDINQVLIDIVEKSKVNNPLLEITGLLFYHNNRFVQVIEGERESLGKLMSILEKDSRHKNIEILIDKEIQKRGFEKWNMDSLNLSKLEELDLLELTAIRDAYQRNLTLDSKTLINFYKMMLQSHMLKPDI